MNYTIGFITCGEKVLLMQKNRPAWQKGKFNGIGGKINKGESPLNCIVNYPWL